MPPFGWTSADNPEGPGRVLVPVEEEQEALRAAAQVLIKDGLKPTARYLNSRGLKPCRAKSFTRQTLLHTFTSEASSSIFTPVERVQIKEALTPKEERLGTAQLPSEDSPGSALAPRPRPHGG